MYFSKITLKPNPGAEKLAAMMCADRYKEHQALWGFFGDDPNAERDFIYRYDDRSGTPGYYVVSKRQPADTTQLWNIATKDYRPALRKGQHLSFMLRANPVVTSGKSGKRHDVVMHEKRQIGYKSMPLNNRPSHQELVEKSGRKWLVACAERHGFSVDAGRLVIDGYRLYSAGKAATKTPIRFGTVDFQGVLQVVEPGLFKKALETGIGKSKAFGCGLMLVRRVNI